MDSSGDKLKSLRPAFSIEKLAGLAPAWKNR
jgi:hypothetical protein